MSLLTKLFCISANSQWATLSEREKLALGPALMTPFLKNLIKTPESGLLYLSTCHRVEIYGYGVDPDQVSHAWIEATEADPKALRTWRDVAALEHFTRVAAGLESDIVGENQIMSQVRVSLREAKDTAILTSPLNHILQRGLRISRNIRSESRIGEGRENLSDLAITTLHEVFETFSDKSFLVVGAGTMSLLALERLKNLKLGKITWVNRSREKIEAHPYARFCNIQDYADLPQLVLDHDVNFLATSAQHPIISKEILSKAGRTRLRLNLKVILDLGLPRNAHPDVSDLGFIVRNVDDFKNILDDQDALQKERIEFANKVLKRELTEIKKDFELESLGPIKKEFIAKWKSLFDQILLENPANPVYNRDRFWAKLGHLLMTKANDLGPYEGGQFLKYLSESFDAFENKAASGEAAENFNVLPLTFRETDEASDDINENESDDKSQVSGSSKESKKTTTE